MKNKYQELYSDNILKNLQIVRLTLNLTQDEVSSHLNITTKHLSEIERGISKPSFDLFIKLINFYNKTNENLLDLNKLFYTIPIESF